MTTEPEEGPNSVTDDDEIDPGWPWSFLLLVAAGAIYLILRFVQLAGKLFE